MCRPVIIVDPLSSGVNLAPVFKKKGVKSIAITLKNIDQEFGFGTKLKKSDFVRIIPNQNNIVNIIEKYNPIAIIPGSEEGVPLAEKLTNEITPILSNDPKKSAHRRHKALMQDALRDQHIPFLKTINAKSKKEIVKWIEKNNLQNTPLIVKPPASTGSDKVFHVEPGADWQSAYNCVYSEPCKITGLKNSTVVVQEQAIGIEFAVGTVSIKGEHYLSHLIQYNKKSLLGMSKTIFDYVEYVKFSEKNHGDLFCYTKKVLDALGIKWGAAHNEIMLTENGPRLIESSARMIGGPTVEFSRLATGSSQADKLVEIYIDGKLEHKKYKFKQTLVPVFLHARKTGIISNVHVLNEINNLSTLFNKFIWFEEGSKVYETIDYLSNIGIVALKGNKDDIIADYNKIRYLESQLIIK